MIVSYSRNGINVKIPAKTPSYTITMETKLPARYYAAAAYKDCC